MKYLLPILICAFMLGGCTAGRLSLNDKINDPVAKSTDAASMSDTSSGHVSPKTTSTATAEPIEASFNETALLDRF